MHYTYFLIDPRDDSVFYVGKGYGCRIRVHSYMMGAKEHHNPKLLSKLRKISSLGLKHKAFKIFEHEDAWPCLASKNHPFFGKEHSKEARDKMSASQLGEKSHNFGKPKSEETKRKISEVKLGRTFSSEHRLNLSIAHKGIHKGENHPMFGKKHSEETRSKISRSLSQFFKKRALGAMVVVALLLSSSVFAEDLSYRVRTEILDQRNPVTVNVSTHAVTTLQFPAQIQSLESDGFTQKPNEEVGDFYISPGLNWVSIRSLKPGAAQNLGVVISGRVYEIMIQTAALNDLSVLFQFAQVPPTRPSKIAPKVCSPLTSN